MEKHYKKLLFSIVALSGVSYLVAYILIYFNILPPVIQSSGLQLGYDFQIYMNSAKAFLTGGDPYALAYKYAPITLLFYIPFTYLKYNLAITLMTALNLVLIGFTTCFVLKILEHYKIRLSELNKALLLFAILFFYPVTSNMYGQANIIILLAFTLFYYFTIVQPNNLKAGTALVIASILKVFPVALLFFSLQRRKKQLISVVLVSSILSAISIALLGWKIHANFIRAVLAFPVKNPISPLNASISSIYYKAASLLNVSADLSWQILSAVLLLSCLYLIYTKRSRTKEWEILSFSLMIILLIALPGFSWTYYAMFLIPSFVLYAYVLKLTSMEKAVLAFALLCFAFPMHALYAGKFIGLGLFNEVSLASYGSLAFLGLTFHKLLMLEVR